MMIHYLHEKTAVVWLSALLAFSQAAYANKNADEPDYTKGDAFELSFPYALGPTGAFGNIWVPKGHTGRTDKTHMIQVAKVDAGSPSDGVLKPFDVILGIGDNSFKSDIRKELAAAIAEAEKNENQGELVLKIWRPELEMGEVREYLTGAAWHQARKEGKNILKDGRKSYILVNKAVPKKTNEGKHIKVTLHLPIMGSFSKTSPWECPKTKAIIDKTAEQIVKKGLVIPARIHPRTKEPIPPQAKGGIANLIDALGLLATGEEKYIPVVQEYARLIGRPDLDLDATKGGSSWGWSHTAIFLAEYYLATEDAYVLPAIREFAHEIALGASDVGTYSHAMAQSFTAHGKVFKYPCAYGAMNQSSISCSLALVLARKCGIKDPEVNRVIKLASEFYSYYVDKGAIPYGDHDPLTGTFDNNGSVAQAAIFFDLVQDKKAATFFSRSVIPSYNVRDMGHSGPYFSWHWGALGAARSGKAAASNFMTNTRWYTELERRADGSMFYQPGLGQRELGKYRNWSTAGSRLMHYCLPRKKLYLTGKGGSSVDPLTPEEVADIVKAGTFKQRAKNMTTDELLKALADWSPVVRLQAAMELGERDDDVVKQLIAMLESKDPIVLYGACTGLQYAGRQSEEAIEKLVKLMDESDDLTLRYYIATAFREARIWQQPPIRDWKYLKHPLVTAEKPNPRVIAALLRQAAKYEPEKDPRRKLQSAIAGTLFYGGRASPYRGYFPGGTGIDKLDRDLLIPAIKSLLKNPNGGCRSTVASVYRHLREDDLNKLWNDIYWATKYQAPSGSMFAGGVRQNGLDIMQKHNFKEGIDLGIDWTFMQWGWGLGSRLKAGSSILKKYGKHTEERYTAIKAGILSLGDHKWARARNGVKPKMEALEKLMAELPDTKPALKSIMPYVDLNSDPLKP